MIELNGKRFAANDREFQESLFHSGGTCAGYYAVKRNRINIMDMQKVLRGVINRHGVLLAANRQADGRICYHSWAPDVVGDYPSFLRSMEEPRAIHRQLCAVTLPES